MAIMRRDDGLYDIPEMGLSGVPEQYIPPGALQQPAPPPDTLVNTSPEAQQAQANLQQIPDERLASNAPVIENPNPQLQALAQSTAVANASPEATPALNENQSIRQALGMPPVAAVSGQQKVDPSTLHFAEGPAKRADGTLMGEENEAYNRMLLAGARSTPGRIVPSAPQLAQEQWVKQELGSKPRMANESPDAYAQRLEDESNNRIDANYTEHQIFDESQAAARRETGRMLHAADIERQQAEDLEQRKALYDKEILERRAAIDQHMAGVQDTLAKMQKTVLEKPDDSFFAEKGFGTRLALGIADGLVAMGAAGAHQQEPKHSFLDDQINHAVQRQRDSVQKYGQLGAMQLSALGELQKSFMSPEAQDAALRSILYSQAAKETEAWGKRTLGGQYGDKANAMQFLLQQKADEEAVKSQQLEHSTVIVNVPQHTVGGQQGGWPGIVAELNQFTKGMDAKARASIVNDAWNDFSTGKPFSLRQLTEPVQAGSVRAGVANAAGQIRFPSWTGFNGTGYIHGKPEVAHQAVNTIAAQKAFVETMGEIKSKAAQFGSSWNLTNRGELKTDLSFARAKLAIVLKEAHSDASAEDMATRLGMDTILSRTSPVDVQRIIDNVIRESYVMARGLVPVDQATVGPGPYDPEKNPYVTDGSK